MQLYKIMATIRPTTLLLLPLGLLPSTFAAKNLDDLAAKSEPLLLPILVNPGETPEVIGNYVLYNNDDAPPSSRPGQGVFSQFYCKPPREYTYRQFDGKNYAGCCPKGMFMSGAPTGPMAGFICCANNTHRAKDDTNDDMGYACCPDGQRPRGSVVSGKYKCCDLDKESSADEQGTLACCPAGLHATGDVASGKFLCCPKGQSYQFTPTGGAHCCGVGEVITGDDNRGWACCPDGQTVSGDAKTGQYLCCGPGHERVATNNPANPFTCCPTGYIFENGICTAPKPVCTNGKQLINGKCACPTGMVEDNTGACVVPKPAPPPASPPPASPPPCTGGKVLVNGLCECPLGQVSDGSGKCVPKPCDSGIVTGKCYEITNRDGRSWGYSPEIKCYRAGFPGDQSAYFKIGKFQFCMDEKCTKGLALNPGEGFSVRDIYGTPPAGDMPNAWLNNWAQGGHIFKTLDYSLAGRFSITKWPCGMYCISGVYPQGLSYTCPAATQGITFSKGDPQACIEVTLKELPCDVRAASNNCLWKNPSDQCCGGNIDCSGQAASSAVAGNTGNAQKPMKGN